MLAQPACNAARVPRDPAGPSQRPPVADVHQELQSLLQAPPKGVRQHATHRGPCHWRLGQHCTHEIGGLRAAGQRAEVGRPPHDVGVALVVAAKGVRAAREAVVHDAAKGEDVHGACLSNSAAAACDELLRCLPARATTCRMGGLEASMTKLGCRHQDPMEKLLPAGVRRLDWAIEQVTAQHTRIEQRCVAVTPCPQPCLPAPWLSNELCSGTSCFDSPMSDSLARQLSVISTLCGLRSRCTIARACSAARPAATSDSSAIACGAKPRSVGLGARAACARACRWYGC